MKRILNTIASGVFLTLIVGCTTGYERANAGWIYVSWNEGQGKVIVSVPQETPEQITILEDQDYAKDSRHVYYCGSVLIGAQPSTFKRVGRYWWKDAKSVYFSGNLVKEADGTTFQVLAHYPWSKDRFRAYRYDKPMPVHDPATFISLGERWAKDAFAYYASDITGGGEVLGAEYTNFQILKGESYARDGKAAYYLWTQIAGADIETFEAINEISARDRLNVYFYGRVNSNKGLDMQKR